MLVLTRKEGESIVIEQPGGEPIVITIAKLRAGSVRVGIDAPKHVHILRAEIVDKAKEKAAVHFR